MVFVWYRPSPVQIPHLSRLFMVKGIISETEIPQITFKPISFRVKIQQIFFSEELSPSLLVSKPPGLQDSSTVHTPFALKVNWWLERSFMATLWDQKGIKNDCKFMPCFKETSTKIGKNKKSRGICCDFGLSIDKKGSPKKRTFPCAHPVQGRGVAKVAMRWHDYENMETKKLQLPRFFRFRLKVFSWGRNGSFGHKVWESLFF